MRFVIQVCQKADVKIDNAVVGAIDRGLVVFVGVGQNDTEAIADRMVKKLLGLRIFADENGKTNLSVRDVNGSLLVISQFTLYADCRHGNRPGFTDAGAPDMANRLYEYILGRCSESGIPVAHGVFGADMKVSLVNDGPFTIILDSAEIC
ncbi:MAG: D-tyrosyl-tRNA(Tyr) deacylase [Clostridiales bacterium]|nr:D-tyrosyl-tRNA(Tyr) deacylase [Clostridiales bacterium]